MKKFLFAIAAGCTLLAFQVNADALSILRNTRIKTEQTVSVNNLTNLYQIVAGHFEGNKTYPTLEELNLPARSLANPYHGLGVEQRVPDKITAGNAGYAYLGAALNGAGAVDAASTPLAFEKPSIRDDGKIVVLFLSGKVDTVSMNAKNCEEVVKALKEKSARPDAPAWDKLVAAAQAIDKAK